MQVFSNKFLRLFDNYNAIIYERAVKLKIRALHVGSKAEKFHGELLILGGTF